MPDQDRWAWVGPNHHRWYASLELVPGMSTMRFGHIGRATGHQVLDELIWPLSSDIRTEAQILGELYSGVLDFWSVRR